MTSQQSKGSRWQIESPTAILVILALMNFINYADRQLIAPLAPILEQPIADGGLGLTKGAIGSLNIAFMIVHSVASIPLGILADRYMRKKLIAIGVAFWSFATAIAAFANNFTQLFLARSSVGIGEATYAPAASALISDKFSPETRARALGVFQIGMVLGGAAALVVGGTVASAYGWRVAFLVFGLPGLVLAGLMALVREDPRPKVEKKKSEPNDGFGIVKKTIGALAKRPAFVWINISGILITFFVGALLFWSAAFIIEAQYGNDTAMLGRASQIFGGLAGVASIAGALVGSLAADKLEKRRPGEGRFLAIGIGTFATLPFAFIAYYSSAAIVFFTCLTVGVFFATWYVGPILAALHESVPENARGIATGTYFFLVHLLGDAISPAIVGTIADQTGSLRTGLVVATVVLGLGGLAIVMARRAAKKTPNVGSI